LDISLASSTGDCQAKPDFPNHHNVRKFAQWAGNFYHVFVEVEHLDYFLAALIFAHLAFCAAAIFLRAARLAGSVDEALTKRQMAFLMLRLVRCCWFDIGTARTDIRNTGLCSA
jgi:hypothetical protein